MPGSTPHHSDKWRSCVDQLTAKGHDTSSAAAICTTSLQNAGEEIYAEAFVAAGDVPGHEFHGNQFSHGAAAEAHKEAAAAHMKAARGDYMHGPTAKALTDRASKASSAAGHYSDHAQNADIHAETAANSYNGAGAIKEAHYNAASSHRAAAKEHNAIDGEPRNLHLLGATGQVRYETLNGRKHLVVPIVALIEGVLHPVNAATPEMVPLATIQKAAASWVGKPVTLGHPSKGGTQCSATDPAIRKAAGIGVIMSSKVAGAKLLQEAWIDEEKARAIAPAVYENLAKGGREEVSVGAFVINELGDGTFNGKPYKGTWVEAQGDHLAVLPGGRGACSCDAGCGTHRAAMHFVAAESIEPIPDSVLPLILDVVAELVDAELRSLGDVPGHDFHGNQYSGGGGGKDIAQHVRDINRDMPGLPRTSTEASKKANEASQKAEASGLKVWHEQAMHAHGRARDMHQQALAEFHSSPNAKADQAAKSEHNAAIQRHEAAIAHHASKAGVKALAAGKMMDCPTCDGTGQVKADGKQADCPTCGGDGKVAYKAAAGARHSSGDMKMIQAVHDHAMALGASCDRKNLETAEEITNLGDVPGHEFHGNQYSSSASASAHEAAAKAHEAAAKVNRLAGKPALGHDYSGAKAERERARSARAVKESAAAEAKSNADAAHATVEHAVHNGTDAIDHASDAHSFAAHGQHNDAARAHDYAAKAHRAAISKLRGLEAAAIQPRPNSDVNIESLNSTIHIEREGTKWVLKGSSGKRLALYDSESMAEEHRQALAKRCA